jgi:hypothetical protein
LEKANSNPDAEPYNLISIVKEYPDEYEMTDLRPSNFLTLSEKILNDEIMAVKFIK